MNQEHEPYDTIQGWCIYCKDAIAENEPVVVDGENKYHTECFNLIQRDEQEYGYNDEE